MVELTDKYLYIGGRRFFFHFFFINYLFGEGRCGCEWRFMREDENFLLCIVSLRSTCVRVYGS